LAVLDMIASALLVMIRPACGAGCEARADAAKGVMVAEDAGAKETSVVP